MQVVPLLRVDGQVAAHVGEGDLGRLLHDVAELAGDGETGLARHRGRFDEEHVAAGAGDGEAGGHAGHGGPHRGLLEELLAAERVAVHERRAHGVRRTGVASCSRVISR